jgi:hypothetical protein
MVFDVGLTADCRLLFPFPHPRPNPNRHHTPHRVVPKCGRPSTSTRRSWISRSLVAPSDARHGGPVIVPPGCDRLPAGAARARTGNAGAAPVMIGTGRAIVGTVQSYVPAGGDEGSAQVNKGRVRADAAGMRQGDAYGGRVNVRARAGDVRMATAIRSPLLRLDRRRFERPPLVASQGLHGGRRRAQAHVNAAGEALRPRRER